MKFRSEVAQARHDTAERLLRGICWCGEVISSCYWHEEMTEDDVVEAAASEEAAAFSREEEFLAAERASLEEACC